MEIEREVKRSVKRGAAPKRREPVTKEPQDIKEIKGGFKKQYLKTKSACKVTFTFPAEAAPDASQVTLVGDFSDWDRWAIPMKRLKDGSFTVTVTLEKGRDYRFRYFIDDAWWANDWSADRYEKNPYGDDDSVVVV